MGTGARRKGMIKQINEQNRELRVQALVIGKSWSQEEAFVLVYHERKLSVPHSDSETTGD